MVNHTIGTYSMDHTVWCILDHTVWCIQVRDASELYIYIYVPLSLKILLKNRPSTLLVRKMVELAVADHTATHTRTDLSSYCLYSFNISYSPKLYFK